MCGRAACTLRPEDIVNRVGAQTFNNQNQYQPSYNVTGGAIQPVVVRVGHARVIESMQWGGAIGSSNFNLINIRLDTLKSNSFYKSLFKKSRCLVVADGYYEWVRGTNSSTPLPYYITSNLNDSKCNSNNSKSDCHSNSGNGSDDCDNKLKDKNMILMAAIYQEYKDNQDKKKYRYSIITTESGGELEKIHDRMPIILNDQECIDRFLNDSSDEQTVQDCFNILENKDYLNSLYSFRVSTLVNNTKNNSSDCIKPEKDYLKEKKDSIEQFFKPSIPDQNLIKKDLFDEFNKDSNSIGNNSSNSLSISKIPKTKLAKPIKKPKPPVQKTNSIFNKFLIKKEGK
ncbi:hypothetical protein CYY_002493 [Polysphondylium violaceum]|uniref:DUF159 family protein n=1 Tax=Polysphondylium violaceum TaxID=133409 RepID=A0A8J4PXZ9_9MYCE|nr:hypothetical protein CYY_002493 [Polysphondylium violaceum]